MGVSPLRLLQAAPSAGCACSGMACLLLDTLHLPAALAVIQVASRAAGWGHKTRSQSCAWSRAPLSLGALAGEGTKVLRFMHDDLCVCGESQTLHDCTRHAESSSSHRYAGSPSILSVVLMTLIGL